MDLVMAVLSLLLERNNNKYQDSHSGIGIFGTLLIITLLRHCCSLIILDPAPLPASTRTLFELVRKSDANLWVVNVLHFTHGKLWVGLTN
jgi:hypothetical protein